MCFQEMFAKKDNKEKNVKASTHLLCPLAEGQKYLAALKWGLPVITKVSNRNILNQNPNFSMTGEGVKVSHFSFYFSCFSLILFYCLIGLVNGLPQGI